MVEEIITFVSDEEKYNIPFVDEWIMREEDEIIRFEAKDILIIPVSRMFYGTDQSILDVYDNTSQLINEVTSNYESAINIMKDSIESTVSETYTTKDDFSTTVESISSKIDQQNDSITASITTATKQLSEDLQDYKDEVTNYMRFDEQGLELGKSNNKFKTRLSNEKLSFIEENQEVAYISNNKMNITDAEIKHQMILGNFAFVPRSNGNMSLKWIRK